MAATAGHATVTVDADVNLTGQAARLEALNLTVQSATRTMSTKGCLERAEAFRAYLEDGTTP